MQKVVFNPNGFFTGIVWGEVELKDMAERQFLLLLKKISWGQAYKSLPFGQIQGINIYVGISATNIY